MTVKLIEFYKPHGVTIIKGSMQYVWDDKGRKYLDCNTGYGAAFLGHRNPYVVNELKNQLDKLMTLPMTYLSDVREECLKHLSTVIPEKLENVFIQNSGTEAVELSLKIARKVTGRKRFVSFIKAFHGRTLGSLMITWNPKYREPFIGSNTDTTFLRFNDASSVDKGINEDVAAVIVEPVQGEGGVVPATKDFLRALRQRTSEVDALLIFDEVQCGFGRTGELWAHQRYGILPDILIAGKAIGGGFPVSLVAVRDEYASKLDVAEHGTTFGGNPLACAALVGSIKALIEDRVVDRVSSGAVKLHKMLRDIAESSKLVREFRGLGYMVGLEMRISPTKILDRLLEKGILALKAGATVLRLLPPYMINNNDILLLGDVIESAIRDEESSRGLK
jgi:acetylornithine/LysW-gamma-L-lysine aminotransferase